MNSKNSAPPQEPAESQYLKNLGEFAKGAIKKSRSKTAAEASSAVEFDLHAERCPAQLPLWGEEVRALPNAIIRAALFTARDTDMPRAYFNNVKIASLSNIELIYRGEELRQDDAAVFMQLLHFAREVPLGYVVEFKARQMLRDMGWSTDGDTYNKLKDSIDRLTATSLKVKMTLKNESSGYGGSFVRNFRWKSDEGQPMTRWQVWMEPEIISLFKPNTVTLLAWGQRKQLTHRSPLTLWLHSFLSSHREPIPLSLSKYAELSNSGAQDIKHYKQTFKRALSRLIDAGFLLHAEISKANIVHVVRNPEKFADPSICVNGQTLAGSAEIAQ